MSGTIYSKFFWQDWASDPKLFRCSAGAQALWMRMLCLAAQSDKIGHVLIGAVQPTDADLAHITGFPVEDISRWKTELVERGVPDLTREGVLLSRRMVRDAQKQRRNSEGGKKSAELRGGKVTRNQTGSKGVHEPPSTRVHNPSAISHAQGVEETARKRGESAGRVNRISKALNFDNGDWTRYQHITRQMCEYEQKGIDVDRDLIPCIEQMAAEGRIPSDLRSLAYFEKPVRAFVEAREVLVEVQREQDAERERKILAITHDQWVAALWKWLFSGEWWLDYGPAPDQEGCRAPVVNVRNTLTIFTEKLGGRPYVRRQGSEFVPIDWPERGYWPLREPGIDDLKIFVVTGEDFRAAKVVPLRKAN